MENVDPLHEEHGPPAISCPGPTGWSLVVWSCARRTACLPWREVLAQAEGAGVWGSRARLDTCRSSAGTRRHPVLRHGPPPPRLWFQQYITPARPPASSARTATASRSAGPATATPTARTALTRTPPIAVTRAARGGGSATGWEGFLQTC